MLSWPPGTPGPSLPPNSFTIKGGRGMRSATGGKAPDATRPASIGVSCIVGSGSAARAGLENRPKRSPWVKTRRCMPHRPCRTACAILRSMQRRDGKSLCLNPEMKAEMALNRLILDTDGGVDDAQALLLLIAAGRPPIAVTTVYGNVDLEAATRNVLAT